MPAKLGNGCFNGRRRIRARKHVGPAVVTVTVTAGVAVQVQIVGLVDVPIAVVVDAVVADLFQIGVYVSAGVVAVSFALGEAIPVEVFLGDAVAVVVDAVALLDGARGAIGIAVVTVSGADRVAIPVLVDLGVEEDAVAVGVQPVALVLAGAGVHGAVLVVAVARKLDVARGCEAGLGADVPGANAVAVFVVEEQACVRHVGIGVVDQSVAVVVNAVAALDGAGIDACVDVVAVAV